MNQAEEFLKNHLPEGRIQFFSQSSATSEMAAEAIGCTVSQIAKTLSFKGENECIVLVAAGDAKVDNPKYKARFNTKAVMLGYDEVYEKLGYPVGGVCPFCLNDKAKIYLDQSLRRFDCVYTAAGTQNSVVRLTLTELEELSGAEGWVDVCKAWNSVP